MEPIKKLSPALFVLIIICFFMPFVNLSCSGQTIMSLTGVQLITGADIKDQNMFGETNSTQTQDDKVDAQPLALFALITALVGLGISFIRKKSLAIINVIVSALGAIFLLLLKFNLDGDAELSGQNVITLDYQAGYWLAFLLFLAGAVLFWLIFSEKTKPDIKTEKPASNI